MSLYYIQSGFESAKQRPTLTAIMYASNLIMGILLSIPVLSAFSAVTAESGYAGDLSQGFDVSLWADILESSPSFFPTLISQLLWVLPVLFVWKMASSAGLIYAQMKQPEPSQTGDQVTDEMENNVVSLTEASGESNESIGPTHSSDRVERNRSTTRLFWNGLASYAWKSTVLGFLYLIPTIVALIIVAIIALVIAQVAIGEVGAFWVQAVFLPLALFLSVAFIDMMHDFGRVEMVVGRKSIMDSWFAGLKWPFHSGNANSIYIGWMVLGMLFLFIPFMIDLTAGGVFIAFIIQQVFLAGRAFISVAWLGSEVLLVENAMIDE